jgi:uncharacterized protein (AIM24 family)
MAEFTVREVEQMRQVRIDIRGETVRARRGALSNMTGDIRLTPRLPRMGEVFRSFFTSEARVRPHYEGAGTILLQPSLGGYHLLDVGRGERWILEPGVYWSSEGGVELGLYRERFWPSLWAGDGLFPFKTTLEGEGRVAINAPGPVDTVEVRGGELRVQGRLVLGRTEGLRFTSELAAPFPRNWLAGQKRLRVFSGTGKALVCWTPYWNQHMYALMTGRDVDRALLE